MLIEYSLFAAIDVYCFKFVQFEGLSSIFLRREEIALCLNFLECITIFVLLETGSAIIFQNRDGQKNQELLFQRHAARSKKHVAK